MDHYPKEPAIICQAGQQHINTPLPEFEAEIAAASITKAKSAY